MKKTTKAALAVVGASVATAALVASPAFATIDFNSATWTVGGVNYQYESSGNDTYGGIEYVTTATQSNYSLGYEETFWYGGALDPWDDYGYCYSGDATETTESNGDVVITCAAYELGNDVWFSQEYRMYDDQMLWRHTFSLENRGTTEAVLDPDGQYSYVYMYQYQNDNVVASSNPTASPTAGCTMTSDDHWLVFAGVSDTTITGWAFQAAGGTAWDATGENCGSSPTAYQTLASIAPGAKVNYLTLIATGEPADTTSGAMDTAFASFVTNMSSFDSLNDTICRGITAGTTYEGWGECGATPELPNTGVDTKSMTGMCIAGGFALVAGAVVLVAIRRRAAQK